MPEHEGVHVLARSRNEPVRGLELDAGEGVADEQSGELVEREQAVGASRNENDGQIF